jgi:hypothetical protein
VPTISSHPPTGCHSSRPRLWRPVFAA